MKDYRERAGRLARVAGILAVVLSSACAGGAARDEAALQEDPITRHNLSGDSDDWEPSIAVGGGNGVHAIAGRPVPPPPGSNRRFGESQIVTWSSTDGGTTFAPARIDPTGGGDQRMKVDSRGTLYASWIRIEWDSTGGGVDMAKGGLILAISKDQGATWEHRVAAPMAPGVADKPELAISPDGRDIYIAFMARGTMDVVASHDGGSTWERHVADSTMTGHWPTSIALAPNGTLYVANSRQAGRRGDTILTVDVALLRSTDRGRTWQSRPLGTASRSQKITDCVHGPTCPVQIPYASVAIDAANRVYLVTALGKARSVYDLGFESSDDGTTWSERRPLSDAPRVAGDGKADSFYPMIGAGEAGLVYVAWFDDREGPIHLWAKRSGDGGASWSPDVRLSRDSGITGIYGEYGGLAVDGRGVMHVTWAEGVGRVGNPGAKGGVWYGRWNGQMPR